MSLIYGILLILFFSWISRHHLIIQFQFACKHTHILLSIGYKRVPGTQLAIKRNTLESFRFWQRSFYMLRKKYLAIFMISSGITLMTSRYSPISCCASEKLQIILTRGGQAERLPACLARLYSPAVHNILLNLSLETFVLAPLPGMLLLRSISGCSFGFNVDKYLTKKQQ